VKKRVGAAAEIGTPALGAQGSATRFKQYPLVMRSLGIETNVRDWTRSGRLFVIGKFRTEYLRVRASPLLPSSSRTSGQIGHLSRLGH
jgi:hypothetical protein